MMMDIGDVFVLSATRGIGMDYVYVYNMKPDLYEIMEVIADNQDYLTFNQVKDIATDLHNEGYVRDGFHEYSLAIKAVQYG